MTDDENGQRTADLLCQLDYTNWGWSDDEIYKSFANVLRGSLDNSHLALIALSSCLNSVLLTNTVGGGILQTSLDAS